VESKWTDYLLSGADPSSLPPSASAAAAVVAAQPHADVEARLNTL
jgi:hypothetical protein